MHISTAIKGTRICFLTANRLGAFIFPLFLRIASIWRYKISRRGLICMNFIYGTAKS